MKPSGTSLKHLLKNPRRKTSSGVSFSGSSLFFPFRLESFPTSARKYRDEEKIRHFLCYVPHKTALSSGRRVCWPVHEDIWRRIDECGGLRGFDITDETFDGINRDLRDLGFSGSKASYELRKICIDHIYQRFGAEKAVSISGDDIRTISRYYADPAQPNIGAVRVVDLIG